MGRIMTTCAEHLCNVVLVQRGATTSIRSFFFTFTGQMSTATVSVVDQPDTSRIDELVAPLSTTTAIMSASVTALDNSGAPGSLMYMDHTDTSYATSMKDTRTGLLNEQTNVCKVGHFCLSAILMPLLPSYALEVLCTHGGPSVGHSVCL